MNQNATAHQHPMQAHLDAYADSHTDQMAAHMRGEHGWTVHEHELGDRLFLLSAHLVAHQDDAADTAECPEHGPQLITQTYIYTSRAGGCSWAQQLACGCFLNVDDERAAR